MTPTDKAREALREIRTLARRERVCAGDTWDLLCGIAGTALSALADEGEGEEVWTTQQNKLDGRYRIYVGKKLVASLNNGALARRIAAVPRLERIERAARALRDAWRANFVAAQVEEFRALDRALNEEPKP